MNSLRLLSALIIFSLALPVLAAGGSSPWGRFNFRQKAEKKEGSRWTLQDWLAQKERNQLMDLWLAMYSPSPYEFFIEGSYQSYKRKFEPVVGPEEAQFQSYSGALGAYATVIGLEADYENNSQESYNDLSGALNLRIMGNAVQGTHLILFYGLRTREWDSNGATARVSNPFAGADLNLYLTRYFGIAGQYRHYFPTEEATVGDVSGTRTEAGVFIDFASVRIFGNWFSDIQKNKLAGLESRIERTGIQSGLKFFF